MLGKIIDINNTDAFINFEDGTTIDISIYRLPKNSSVGDTVNIELNSHKMLNDKYIDFF